MLNDNENYCNNNKFTVETSAELQEIINVNNIKQIVKAAVKSLLVTNKGKELQKLTFCLLLLYGLLLNNGSSQLARLLIIAVVIRKLLIIYKRNAVIINNIADNLI